MRSLQSLLQAEQPPFPQHSSSSSLSIGAFLMLGFISQRFPEPWRVVLSLNFVFTVPVHGWWFLHSEEPLGKPHFCNHQARTVGIVKGIDFLCHIICEPSPSSAVSCSTNLCKGIWRDLKGLNCFILTGSLGSGNIAPWNTLEQALKNAHRVCSSRSGTCGVLRTWALIGNEQKDKKPCPAPQLLPPGWWGDQ